MENRRRRPRSDEYIPVAGCPPRWAWLLAGLLIGIFASFLFYLREVAPLLPQSQSSPTTATTVVTQPVVKVVEPPVNPIENPSASTENKATENKTTENKATENKATDNKTTTLPATEAPTQHFEFYDLLPKGEVKVPSASPSPQDDLPVTTPGRYVLQVGLFRDKQQAAGLKAHLANLGIDAQIGQTTAEGGEEWYRVHVGPFTNLEQLNHTRAVLSDNEIHAILLKF
jgi:cell division protein FtsN